MTVPETLLYRTTFALSSPILNHPRDKLRSAQVGPGVYAYDPKTISDSQEGAGKVRANKAKGARKDGAMNELPVGIPLTSSLTLSML